MTSLRHVSIDTGQSLGSCALLIRTLLLLPQLQSLDLQSLWSANIQQFPPLEQVPVRPSNLRSVVYDHAFTGLRTAVDSPYTLYYGLRWEGQLAVESYNLGFILSQRHDSIESLTLPAQLAPLLLTSPFPSLNSISLRGWCPQMEIIGQDHHLLWRSALDAHSRLTSLDFCVVQAPEIGFSTRPPKSTELVQDMSRKLQSLKSLTFANASPDDPIFSVLPSTLEELIITTYPLPYIYHVPGCNIPIHIMPFGDLSKIMTNGSFQFLRRLDVAYNAESSASDAALFSALPGMCPELRSLEINRYNCPPDEDLYGITVRYLSRIHFMGSEFLPSRCWKAPFRNYGTSLL